MVHFVCFSGFYYEYIKYMDFGATGFRGYQPNLLLDIEKNTEITLQDDLLEKLCNLSLLQEPNL